jgi:hypothetical protein
MGVARIFAMAALARRVGEALTEQRRAEALEQPIGSRVRENTPSHDDSRLLAQGRKSPARSGAAPQSAGELGGRLELRFLRPPIDASALGERTPSRATLASSVMLRAMRRRVAVIKIAASTRSVWLSFASIVRS